MIPNGALTLFLHLLVVYTIFCSELAWSRVRLRASQIAHVGRDPAKQWRNYSFRGGTICLVVVLSAPKHTSLGQANMQYAHPP